VAPPPRGWSSRPATGPRRRPAPRTRRALGRAVAARAPLLRRVPCLVGSRRLVQPVDPPHEECGILPRPHRLPAHPHVDRAGRAERVQIEDRQRRPVAPRAQHVPAAPRDRDGDRIVRSRAVAPERDCGDHAAVADDFEVIDRDARSRPTRAVSRPPTAGNRISSPISRPARVNSSSGALVRTSGPP